MTIRLLRLRLKLKHATLKIQMMKRMKMINGSGK